MANITYTLHDFSSSQATSGVLCVMTSSNPTAGNSIESTSGDFKGAGICIVKSPNNNVITIEGVSYAFNSQGLPVGNTDSSLRLWIGTLSSDGSKKDERLAGTYITTTQTATTTRGNTGEINDGTTVENKAGAVMVDNLNARDEFAVHVLRGLLAHHEDPSSVSAATMSHYCSIAYAWAASMMVEAANARATLDDKSVSESARTVDVSTLDNNTDKLLNDIVKSLQRTDKVVATETIIEATEEGEEDTKKVTYDYYEQVTIPELTAILAKYVAHTPTQGESPKKTTVGLDDLIQSLQALTLQMSHIHEDLSSLHADQDATNSKLTALNAKLDDVVAGLDNIALSIKGNNQETNS